MHPSESGDRKWRQTAWLAAAALGLVLVFVAGGSEAQLSTFAEKLPGFADFKRIYGKIYASSQEDTRREKIFNKTIAKIDKHNRLYNEGKATYALYPCEYSDMDEQEVATFLKGIVLPDDMLDPEEFNKTLHASGRSRRDLADASGKELALPEALDYRKTGCVSLPKNQKFCGSCWAFATTSAIETMKCLKSGRLETMSEQQLVDCANRKAGYKSQGCSGGIFSEAFRYVQDNGGLDDDECYPYGSNDLGECRYNPKCKSGTVTGWRRIAPNENALKEALVRHGPVVAAIHTNDDFFSYNSGVYDDPKCTNERSKINHGVAIMGYGRENGKDFWIVKNSWGYTWGEQGFNKVVRGNTARFGELGACCIACYAYVIDI